MSSSFVPRDQVEGLVHCAVEVARFAGRWSSDWMSPEGVEPSPIGQEVRDALSDESKEAGLKLREAVADLRRVVRAVAKAASGTEPINTALLKNRARCVTLASAAVEAAPATAVALFDKAVKRWHAKQDLNGRPLTVGGRKVVIALEQLVRPMLSRLEDEVGARKLDAFCRDLRQRVDAFELVVQPNLGELAKQSPDGGRHLGGWCRASWSEVLIAIVEDLLKAATARHDPMLRAAHDALRVDQFLPDLIVELAKGAPAVGVDDPEPEPPRGRVGRSSGPGRTFKALCDEIVAGKLERKQRPEVSAGDAAMQDNVMDRVSRGDQSTLPSEKATQYLTPKGRLVKAGLITREQLKVVVTEAGASFWRENFAET